MGIGDKIWVKVTCAGCGINETSSATDKGSTWGSPSWNSYGKFETFHVTQDGGGAQEPAIMSAICVACGGTGRVEESYGFGRPSGF